LSGWVRTAPSAICRWSGTLPTPLIPEPAPPSNAQRYFNFLFAAVNDARWDPDIILAAIDEAGGNLDPSNGSCTGTSSSP